MNTPGHMVVNLALIGKKQKPGLTFPIFFGALAPDIPIFLFYFFQKIVLKIPEMEIWRDVYFQSNWQNLFDAFHSIPIILAALLISHAWKREKTAAFFASMLLHTFFDFPLHYDDAHRHFFPLSDFRFLSPVSYWDPNRYGQLGAFVELTVVTVASIAVWRRDKTRLVRGVVALALILYASGLVVALMLWGA
ncbi:MAG: hypothetical protein V3S46_01305 [Nitrospinota bacterium]